MADYNIDITEKIIDMGYDPSSITVDQELQLKMALSQLVDAAYAECKRLAQERLHKTRVDYLKNLNLYNTGSDSWTIDLGEQAQAYDDGFNSYNMKPGLLHGPNAKISAKGIPYNIVPIEGSTEYGGTEGKTEFRIVSGSSPANSWIHPGFAGVHILDDVAEYLDVEVENLIRGVLG